MGFFQRIKNFFVQADYDDSHFDDEDEADDIKYIDRRPEPARPARRAPRENDTIKLPGRPEAQQSPDGTYALPQTKRVQVVKSTPADIDAAAEVSTYLKSGKMVIVNLEGVDFKDAQRVMDFIGGVLHAIDGEIMTITNRVFAVAPKGAEFTESYKEHLKAGGVFPTFGRSKAAATGR